MRKLLLRSILVVAAAVLPAGAQELLPSSFASWTSPAAAVRLRPEGLEEWAGSEAGILREYGTVAAERREYARGGEALRVTLYRMRDPSGAYGAYTFLRTDRMTPITVAQYSSISPDRALLVSGNFLLDIAGNNLLRSAADLKTLASSLATHADKSPFPTIGQYLPERGRAANSDRYLLGPLALGRLLPLGNGDWMGLADGAEAELARYKINGQDATLLLVEFPTPQAAARKLDELGHWFPLNPERDVPAVGPAPIFARRQGSLLALVANNNSRVVATRLLDQVHYETQVTWNEPTHKLTDPSISAIVVGAITGTGIILLFAAVAGISFGGVRIVVKYFFPGKVFDRAAHVEILQLGLSSKPIEAKDFY